MLFKNEDKFNPEINKVTQETGVPMSVLKGFFALESAFDPNSYREEHYADSSKDDASYGLAQVLYGTARGLGYTGEPKGLFDPYTSAKYGALFIKALHSKYPRIPDVIAAYNMGFARKAPQTTPRIIGIYGQPAEDWIYANQPYVDRVSAYIAYYQAKERNDNEAANRIEVLIKKKYIVSRRKIWQSLIGEIPWA
jgi:soluble lytic murein transglycosylase-like protein